MATIEYHSDALADDFALFCDDVRRVETWRRVFINGPRVSALTIKPSNASLKSIVDASQRILISRHGPLASLQLWLFLADAYWQEETRLTDYWKIWRYLSRKGIVWPQSHKGPEIAIRVSSCVRYASTGLVNDASFDTAMAVMFQAWSPSFMLLSADHVLLSEDGVLSLFDAAFSRQDDASPETRVDWGRLIQTRATRGDVLIKRAGLFDEFTWALDLFARPDVLSPLLQGDRETWGQSLNSE